MKNKKRTGKHQKCQDPDRVFLYPLPESCPTPPSPMKEKEKQQNEHLRQHSHPAEGVKMHPLAAEMHQQKMSAAHGPDQEQKNFKDQMLPEISFLTVALLYTRLIHSFFLLYLSGRLTSPPPSSRFPGRIQLSDYFFISVFFLSASISLPARIRQPMPMISSSTISVYATLP